MKHRAKHQCQSGASPKILFFLFLIFLTIRFTQSQTTFVYNFTQDPNIQQNIVLQNSVTSNLPSQFSSYAYKHLCKFHTVTDISVLCCPDGSVFYNGVSAYVKIPNLTFKNNQDLTAANVPSPCSLNTYGSLNYLFIADLVNSQVLTLLVSRHNAPTVSNPVKLPISQPSSLLAFQSINGAPVLILSQTLTSSTILRYDLYVGPKRIDFYFEKPAYLSLSQYSRIFVMLQQSSNNIPSTIPIVNYSSVANDNNFLYQKAEIRSQLCANYFSASGKTYIVFTCDQDTQRLSNSSANFGEIRVYIRDQIADTGIVCKYQKIFASTILDIQIVEGKLNSFLDIILVLQRNAAGVSSVMIFKMFIDKYNKGRRYCSIDTIQSGTTLVTAGLFLEGNKTDLQFVDFPNPTTSVNTALLSSKLLCGNEYYYNTSGSVPTCTLCEHNVVGNNQTFGLLLQSPSLTCSASCRSNRGAVSISPQSRSVCDYTCTPDTNVGPNCSSCSTYRGYSQVSTGVTFSKTCGILTCPTGQHQLNGICISSTAYYQLTDPCLNVQIASISDCATCVNRGCTFYQNNICTFFRSDAVQNWQRQTLFTTHPDAKYCPTQGQAPTCTSYGSLNSDISDLNIFSLKPNFIGFTCVIKLSSSNKDIRIKLKRGQNQLKNQFNERIYLTVYKGGSSFQYISNTAFNTVDKKISLQQNNFVEIYYLKISNHQSDTVLTVEIDSDLLTDDVFLAIVIVCSVIGFLLLILLIICLIAACRRRRRIKREKLLFINENRAEVKVIDQTNGVASRAIIRRDKKIEMSERESQALNKRLSMRAVYTDRNTQSSMMSARDRLEEQNENGNMRRSSIVVSPASKFTTPYQGESRFDFRPHIRQDDIQLKGGWDKTQDCTYIQNKKVGCSMKSDAYYMAKRLESKNNTTRSSIGNKHKKGNFSRSTIDTKKNPRVGRSILTTEQGYLQDIHNPRQSLSITSGQTPQHQRIGSYNSNTVPSGEQFVDDQGSVGGLSSIVGPDQVLRRQNISPIQSPNQVERKTRKSMIGKPPIPSKRTTSQRKSSIEEAVVPSEFQMKQEVKRKHDEKMNKSSQRYDSDKQGLNQQNDNDDYPSKNHDKLQKFQDDDDDDDENLAH